MVLDRKEPMTNKTILEFRQVGFSYEDTPFALQDLSLFVNEREKIAVLGNNGAGKSTFFLLCNGVLRPHSGEIFYRGAAVRSSKKDLTRLREKVGIVFQDPNQQLIGSTVEGEVSFGPMNLKLERDEVALRIQEALSAMELEGCRERPPHYLSGGEKKRVSIADVLAMRPEVILMDEPTASLDPAGVDMLKDVLARLEAQGKTLLISTHDIDFAWSWAERVLVFTQGRLAADAPPEEIFADEALLSRAGLRRPHLYDAALILKEQGLLSKADGWPRTAQDLKKMLKSKRS